jgi:hypothetical protein
VCNVVLACVYYCACACVHCNMCCDGQPSVAGCSLSKAPNPKVYHPKPNYALHKPCMQCRNAKRRCTGPVNTGTKMQLRHCLPRAHTSSPCQMILYVFAIMLACMRIIYMCTHAISVSLCRCRACVAVTVCTYYVMLIALRGRERAQNVLQSSYRVAYACNMSSLIMVWGFDNNTAAEKEGCLITYPTILLPALLNYACISAACIVLRITEGQVGAALG